LGGREAAAANFLGFMATETTTETKPGSATALYRFVAEQSHFTVQAFAEGLFSAFGHDPVIGVHDFAGELQFVPGTFEGASLKITVNANLLSVIDKVDKEKDRREIEHTMREEVLETGKYPEIVFSSSNISVSRLAEGRYRARVVGDLTLHGVTQHSLWIPAEVTMSGETLQARGEFSIKQTDFKIKLVSVAGGTLKVKNELKCAFDVAAQKEG
jgi:polyisoprenoid-binding protein YceI